LATYVLAGTVSGAMAGAVTGALGATLSEAVRYSVGTVLGVVAMGVGVASLVGDSRPLQCDRETPREWVQRGPVVWPLLNGAALGFGATSRLGFWLWYFIPIGAFLMGEPLVGAAIWAAYGFTRTASAGVVWYLQARGHDSMEILARRSTVSAAASALTIALGSALFVLMGL
jgi:hypothetical protein